MVFELSEGYQPIKKRMQRVKGNWDDTGLLFVKLATGNGGWRAMGPFVTG